MFGAAERKLLGDSVGRLETGARNLAGFVDQDPGLAQECGVEIGALEARTILASGAMGRLREAALSGREILASDLETAKRLEGVLSLAAQRIGLKLEAMDQSERERSTSQLGAIIGTASGVISMAQGAAGFIRSILGK